MTPRARLYLSSYLLGDDPEPIRWRGAGRGRAAIVMNALDPFGATRLRNWDREVGLMRTLGYDAEELDLRAFVDRPGRLDSELDGTDLLWIAGGNAFTLARIMTACDFGTPIGPRLDAGALTYAGYSAAACVAGPDLAGIELMDEPEVVPDGYDPEWPATTLGLLDERIVPHWDSDHPEAQDAARAARWLAERGLAYRCLRDGEAVVVA